MYITQQEVCGKRPKNFVQVSKLNKRIDEKGIFPKMGRENKGNFRESESAHQFNSLRA